MLRLPLTDRLFLRDHLDHSALWVLGPHLDQRFHLDQQYLRDHLDHLGLLLHWVRGRRLHRLFLLHHLSRLVLWLL